MIKVYNYLVDSVGENCYSIVNDNNEALIVDPGDQADQLIEWIHSNGWHPQAVILTHAHMDHIGALDAIREQYQIEAYLHNAEKDFIIDPVLNFSRALHDHDVVQKPVEQYWDSMGVKTVGSFTFEIRHVPGHSPGSVIYVFHEDEIVIAGDTLFQGSIGRTDFPGGSHQQLMDAIDSQILTLPDNFKVYPGHGPSTSIGIERANNPFLIKD